MTRDLTKQAMAHAQANGMHFRPTKDPALAEIFCAKCDWLKGLPSQISVYAKEPFGCQFCKPGASEQ